MGMTPLSVSFLAIVTRSGDENTTAWDAVKETSQCELMPKNRHTTLQALEQTLNKIFLQNNGAKVTAGYSKEEENIGMVAEEGEPVVCEDFG